MLLVCLWYWLILVYSYYDDLMMKFVEIMLVEPSRIVKTTKNAIHILIALEGKNYDLWLPYNDRLRTIMKKTTIMADENKIQYFPGVKPTVTVADLDYQIVTIKYRKKMREYLYEDNNTINFDIS